MYLHKSAEFVQQTSQRPNVGLLIVSQFTNLLLENNKNTKCNLLALAIGYTDRKMPYTWTSGAHKGSSWTSTTLILIYVNLKTKQLLPARYVSFLKPEMSSSEEEERENYSHCAMVKSQSDRYSKILEKFDIQRDMVMSCPWSEHAYFENKSVSQIYSLPRRHVGKGHFGEF